MTSGVPSIKGVPLSGITKAVTKELIMKELKIYNV